MVVTKDSELPKPEEVRIPGFRQWYVGNRYIIRQNVIYDGKDRIVRENRLSSVYTQINNNIGEYVGNIPSPQTDSEGELCQGEMKSIIMEAIERHIKSLSDKQHRLKEMIEELRNEE